MQYDFEPISASLRKMVLSLGRAKNRRELGLFVVEGSKSVTDTIAYFDCTMLMASSSWLDTHPELLSHVAKIYRATSADLERMSQLSTAPEVIAVYKIPCHEFDVEQLKNRLVVALDHIQDPGNLGTIVRLCDWMGVTDVLASEGTADVFNPKVVQATMGSIARVRVHYVDLPSTLDKLATAMPIYGTFLDGESLYATPLSAIGVVVMGNEGRGVSPEVAAMVSRRLLIPSFPPERPTAESLNVATATAITLAEFRRRIL